MAVTVQSTATGTPDVGQVVITKPTGLAVGNLMIAIVKGSGAPAGWATVVSQNTNYPFYFFSKTADSSDVAASDFTFTGSGRVIGCILRIDGHYQVTDSEITYQGTPDADNTQTVTVAIDAFIANSLIIMGVQVGDTTSQSISNYSITGQTNPTWTEVIDTYNSVDDYSISVAYANLSTNAGITALSFYQSEIANDVWNKAGCVIIPPQLDGDGTVARLAGAPQIFVPEGGNTAEGTIALLVGTPTITAPVSTVTDPASTNTTKNAGANVVNTSKS